MFHAAGTKKYTDLQYQILYPRYGMSVPAPRLPNHLPSFKLIQRNRDVSPAPRLSRAVVTLASAPGGATSRRRADAPTRRLAFLTGALYRRTHRHNQQVLHYAHAQQVLYYRHTVIILHIAAYQGIQLRVYFTNLSSFNMPLQHTPEHKMAMPRCVLASGIALPRQI